MTGVHQTEVDGVRCFWVETGRPTLAARLVFRFGMVDEPLVESGWQHLLEHLALEGRGGGALQVNGAIGLLDTSFDAHGPAEDVATHLAELTGWLSAPVLDRLTHEAGVLRAEAALRAGSPTSDALAWRYGALGPGVVAYQEPAIGAATEEALRARAARVLTRANAVLVLDGPPPPSLRLVLPDGERLAVPPARPCVLERRAAYVRADGVVVSGVVRRSSAILLGQELLREGLVRELRTEAGAAYAPWVAYEPVDRDHAVVVAGSDVTGAAMPTVVNRTLSLVRRLRALAPDADHLESLRAGALQRMSDPYALMGLAVGHAADHLSGREPRTGSERADEVRAVTGRQVMDAFEELHSTLLLGVPGAATWAGELPMLEPRRGVRQATGRPFRSINWPADRTHLRVDEHGLALRTGVEERSVPFESVAAVLTWPDGLRQLVQHDGYAATIDPRAWRRGGRAVARIDAALPPRLALPQPAGDRSPVHRVGLWTRWAWPVRRLVPTWLIRSIVLLVVLLAIGAVLTVLTGEPLFLPAPFIAVLYLAYARHHDR